VVPHEGAAQAVGEGRVGGEAAAGAPLVGAEIDGSPGEAGRADGEQAGGEAEVEEFGGGVDPAARRDLDDRDAAGRAELVLDDGELDADGAEAARTVGEEGAGRDGDAEGGVVAEGEAAGRAVGGWPGRGGRRSLTRRTAVGPSARAAARTRRPRARRRAASGAARSLRASPRTRPAGRSRRAGTARKPRASRAYA